jgi:hypothetical protein
MTTSTERSRTETKRATATAAKVAVKAADSSGAAAGVGNAYNPKSNPGLGLDPNPNLIPVGSPNNSANPSPNPRMAGFGLGLRLEGPAVRKEHLDAESVAGWMKGHKGTLSHIRTFMGLGIAGAHLDLFQLGDEGSMVDYFHKNNIDNITLFDEKVWLGRWARLGSVVSAAEELRWSEAGKAEQEEGEKRQEREAVTDPPPRVREAQTARLSTRRLKRDTLGKPSKGEEIEGEGNKGSHYDSVWTDQLREAGEDTGSTSGTALAGGGGGRYRKPR